MTPPTFAHPDLWILPARGRFTALEALDEWLEFLPDLFARWDAWKASPDESDKVSPSARHAFHASGADLARLLPHLADDDAAAAKLHALQQYRDEVRELVDPGPPLPDPLAELAQVQAELRASLEQQIHHAATILRCAGTPSLPPPQRELARMGWECMAQTIIRTADLPGLDKATLDTLTDLIGMADLVRALFADGAKAGEAEG